MEFCNQCKYFTKVPTHSQGYYNAICGKCQTCKCPNCGNSERDRTVEFFATDQEKVITPRWCPFKLCDHKEDIVKEYVPLYKRTYQEKRSELMKVNGMVKYNDITVGELYVVPKILYQKRQMLKAVSKTDIFTRFEEIDMNGNALGTFRTLYPTDIESKFIVKVHKF